jgi:16S rRNA G966 N2-methylase RsmD
MASILNAAATNSIATDSDYKISCPGVRALVVDDEPMNLLVANGIFSSYGMVVTTAQSGPEAIDKCVSETFDIIFMDPPYKDVPLRLDEATKLISTFGMLKEGGMLIVEHDKDCEIPEELNVLKNVRSCSYGLTVLTFFKDIIIGG